MEMLTVRKLIDYLKTCNPDARILAFETNSNAYIEQLPNLPNHLICTVGEDKIQERKFQEQWFRNCSDKEEKIEKEMAEIYRYTKDDDIIMKLGNY